MSEDLLANIWFLLLGVLLLGYAILDGFDLGVGILHPVAKNDRDRRIMMNSIGPLWDGNEVWLITFGGALFAMFPVAYATVFSGFYTAFMLLLFALITRAVSLEFRSKTESGLWRGLWDTGFFASSTLAALLFGVAVGNLIKGLAIDERHAFQGTVFDQLGFVYTTLEDGSRLLSGFDPYPLAVGALVIALFAMHGSIFLYLKTEGSLQEQLHGWMWRAFGVFLTAYILVTMWTLVQHPQAVENLRENPVFWIVPVLNVLAIANIPRAIHLRKPAYAFLSSSATIAGLIFLLATAIYPKLVPSTIDPRWDLTIFNASSSAKTMGIGLIIAVVGMPIVLAYTAVIYWTFRGKTKLDRSSY